MVVFGGHSGKPISKTNNNIRNMNLNLFLAAALAAPLSAQVADDQHWFYDETDHRGEAFAMLSSDTYLYMGGLFTNG